MMKYGVLSGILTVVCAMSVQANLITNGDFEAGDLSGWIVENGAAVTAGTPALSGATSAQFAGGGTWNTLLTQNFAATTGSDVTLSMQFNSSDTSGNRNLNLYWEADNTYRLNLYVNGLGELYVYDNAGTAADGWNQMLTGISSGVTHDLTIAVTGIGSPGGASYTVDVDGNTSSSIQAFQSGVPGNFTKLSLVNNVAAYTADNISVIPEPATIGLVALFGGAIVVIRRNFKL